VGRRAERRGLGHYLTRPVSYVLAGGGCLLLDILVLYGLHSIFRVELYVATTVAYLVDLIANYAVNRWWVFAGGRSVAASGIRYVCLVGVNYLATIAIVATLTSVHVHYVVARLAAVVVTTIWNYLAYKHWIFRGHGRPIDVGAGEVSRSTQI
jgi:putative flippase GtrA